MELVFMVYYLDFEADVMSKVAISIGCIKENGDTFYSLIQYKGIATKTVEITGITKKEAQYAPSAQEVFTQFRAFIGCDPNPVFCVYGNADRTFLEKAINKGKIRLDLKMYLDVFIVSHLHDVSTCWNEPKKLSIRYTGERVKSHHALSDALMLKYICQELTLSTLLAAPKLAPCVPKKKKKEVIKIGGDIIQNKAHKFQLEDRNGGKVYATSIRQACKILYTSQKYDDMSARQRGSVMQALRRAIQQKQRMKKYLVTAL